MDSPKVKDLDVYRRKVERFRRIYKALRRRQALKPSWMPGFYFARAPCLT